MKKIIFIIFMFLFIPFVSAKEIDIHLFYSETCITCKEEIDFLNEYVKDKDINVILYETTRNKLNDELLIKTRKALKNKNNEVPYTVIGTMGITGFGETQKEQLINAYNKYNSNEFVDIVDVVNKGLDTPYKIDYPDETVVLPFIGKVDSKNVSIPLASMVIGLVDGFNPCAMWVLLFLLSIVITMKNRKKMWTIGLTFIITSALVYLAFMLAWLNIAIPLTKISWVRFIIGLISLIGALFNLTAYYKTLKNGDGCQIVDKKQRKSVINRINKIVEQANSKKTFVIAILGVIGLAISVNLIELACSSGLPLVFTQILAYNDLNNIQYLIYLLIYVFFFLIDDIIVFSIAMKSLKLKGISTKYSKYSHLIGGIIMLLIGILLIIKPEWLMFNF